MKFRNAGFGKTGGKLNPVNNSERSFIKIDEPSANGTKRIKM